MLPLKDEIECHDFPVVNTVLILVNIAAFIYQCVQPDSLNAFFHAHGTIASRIVHHFDLQQFGTILTAMFLHAGFAHIIGNLWILYLFGDNVEDRMGHFKYLVFYIACGIAADALQIASNPNSMIPCIGASGAIAGVLGAYMVLHPDVKVKTWIMWFWVMSIPSWVIIGGWFLLQCMSASLPASGEESIAWFAHIGGFIAGMVLLFLLKSGPEQRLESLDDIVHGKSVSRLIIPPQQSRKRFPLTTAFGIAIILGAVGYAGYAAFSSPSHSALPIVVKTPVVPPNHQSAAKSKQKAHTKHTRNKRHKSHVQNSNLYSSSIPAGRLDFVS
jgi:membrane associated rhomboid family serine protease